MAWKLGNAWDLNGRLAVVTGAAGGIGRATCMALAERGCRIVATDVDEIGLDETRDIIDRLGSKTEVRRVDVSSKDEVFALAEVVARDHGGADVLVNNAGVTCISDFVDHSLEDFEWVMSINFWGVVYGCKAFLPQLRSRDRSHIVNISSIFGVVGMPRQSSYCSSKFAVRGLSESLRNELAEDGVGVTSVHPGGVKTDIVRSARADGDEYVGQKTRTIELFEKRAIDPLVVGRGIARAVERDHQRLVIAPGARPLDLAQRIWPGGVSRLVRWQKNRV